MATPAICVAGSINLDMVAYVPRFPAVGETLHGHRFSTGYGGKGANQAVMAARLGGAVHFVGRVGDDLFGRDMYSNLASEGIDVTHVRTSEGVSSGVAVITVDEQGANTIIVIPGANGEVTPADVELAQPAIAQAGVLVCQLEVPLSATMAALRSARAAGVRTIFNPAPAVSDLPEEVFKLSDILCPNETEAQILTGIAVESQADAEAAARQLLARGVKSVIMTLGARGSLWVNAQTAELVPSTPVRAVDTVGAGDAFVGSLAYFLAAGKQVTDAMWRANQIAAISVQSPGAQSSFPRAAALPGELFHG